MTSHRPLFSLRGALSSAAFLSITLALAGCQSQEKKADKAAPPASSERANEIRASIQKSQPNALVGIVILTLDDRPYTAIGDVPVQDAKVGQTVTFIDGNGQPFNAGTVVAIVGDSLHVKFDTAGKRPPQKGDLAMIMRE
jgi:hypothetical protein